MERFVFFSLAAGVGHSGEPQWIACTRDLKGGGHKAGKKFEVNKTVIGRTTVEKRSWKFDSGIIYNCGKERSTGGVWGRGYQKRHSTQRNTVQKQGRSALSCQSGDINEQMKNRSANWGRVGNWKRLAEIKTGFTTQVREGGSRDI